jgi:Flp pilus assembly protein protease CpaA
MKIFLRDLIVLALALCGGVSDFNFLDVPYWIPMVLFFVYIVLRVYGKGVKIKKID